MPGLSSPTMPSDDAMTPLERLLNLVGLLLETRRPLTFEEIRETLEAYQGENVDSAKRKFERDKDVLREYGVPLAMRGTDEWDVEQGYLIPKDEYYLPEIAFTPEEITALFLAAQGGTDQTAAAQGVRKLLYGADGGVLIGMSGGPLVAGPDARSERVLAAAAAADGHRRVRFGYRTVQGSGSEREVDAFAVVYRGGHWYLVGHDRERDDVRAFRLSRCTSDLVEVGEGATPPEGFDADDHVSAGPWSASAEVTAVVAFTPEAAVLAQAQFAGARREGTRDDGRHLLALPSSDDDLLASLLLQYGPDAEVVSPAALRDEVIVRLEKVRDA
jgi:proteasome accessory factor B